MDREIHQQLNAKEDHFREIYHAVEHDEEHEGEDPFHALNESVLEIKRALVVVLATGGPHVEAVVELTDDGSISEATLYGYWGGSRSSRNVDPDSGLFRALEYYTEASNG
ncbi:hypothetical protein [Nesterenkonia massiliensis]|uniref:hypothetical protein n=1 Tax=Nesterenkonia massiliensis TaxID=1232429 RepID=UPI00040C2A22|nr:hypothetical protein [Nesterenkonia massiliensis]